MHCPACNLEAADESRFCEECGTALSASAVAAGTRDGNLRCAKCGAGPSAIDGDGFCTQCGHARRAAARDRFEDALSSKAAGVSDIGKKYEENQDFFAIGSGRNGEIVAVVADGVSRSQNAMQGSKLACEAALASILHDLAAGAAEPNDILKRAAGRAQESICKVPFERGLTEEVAGEKEPIPPAQATLVGVLVRGRRVTIGWLGDSRAYWVGRRGTRRLTTDHSWFDDVVGSGEMTAEEARRDRRARGIERSLGADLDGNDPGITPDALTLNLTEPGVLLVVSDGFYVYADERIIGNMVNGLPRDIDALTMARALVELALRAGGRDNITVVALIL
jgi:serine/threonine protein phosphatase PrpC